jgi:hypothetical protein
MARAEPALYRRPFFFLSLSVCVCVENIKNPENILQCFSALMLCVVTFFSLDGKGEKMGFLTFSVPVRTRIVNGIFFFFFFFQFFSVVVDLYKTPRSAKFQSGHESNSRHTETHQLPLTISFF